MPEVIVSKSFKDGSKDAYRVQYTNDADTGGRAYIVRADGSMEWIKASSKEHFHQIMSRVVDGQFSEEDK